MLDLNADDGSVRKRRYKSPIPETPEPRAITGNQLDRQKYAELHTRLLDIYTRELDRQYDNRMEQAQDDDFYDNIQWDPDDARTVEGRGQIPLVYNVISASIDWVTGTEKRARSDFKILPRRKEDGKPAERKTALLKYLADVNRTPFHRSRAFEDAAKVGIGWLEDGVQSDAEDEPVYSRYENWRNMLWDSAATELDLKDARYIFRTKWVDLDVACALFKKRRAVLERSAASGDDFMALDAYGDEAMDSQELEGQMAGHSMTSDRINGYQRRRVRLIEAWIKLPADAERVRGGMFSGELYDPASPGHQDSIESGEAEIQKRSTMRMHVAIFCDKGLLWFSHSPYRHNRFPFTPIWAYRRARDGLPYGMVRRIKDIQTDVNKRASKALHILSTSKVIMDEDALPEDVTIEDFLEEVSRPDAVIRKKPGKELKIDADRDLSQFQLELMSRSIAMIQQSSGVTDELLGRRTNATSGIAIQRRQDQGSLATAKLFDNLLFAMQVQGEKQLSLVEQFCDEEKAFRITNMRGSPEFVEINDGLPENDITRTKADFIVSDSQWHATLRQAAVESLMEAISRMPAEVGLVMIDLVVENMDLPNREEIVRRIRTITKQSDPDQEEPTEEEIAAQKQQAIVQQLTLEEAMAKIENLKADIATKKVKAAETLASIEEIESKLPSHRVDAQQKALAAARDVIELPATAHIADHILAETGFVAQSDRDRQLGLGGMPGAAPPASPVQQSPQQQQPLGLMAA